MVYELGASFEHLLASYLAYILNPDKIEVDGILNDIPSDMKDFLLQENEGIIALENALVKSGVVKEMKSFSAIIESLGSVRCITFKIDKPVSLFEKELLSFFENINDDIIEKPLNYKEVLERIKRNRPSRRNSYGDFWS